MKNGEMLQDTHGNPLHAHGGCMLEVGGYYYWFGEDRRGRVRVSCYRSRDLRNWEFRNHVLTLDSETKEHYVRTERLMEKAVMTRDHHQIFAGCNLERPKVALCPKTGKYVMWMHYENGADYSEAKCAIAVCDRVDGDYTYLGAFSPIGNMSRDCTLFVDDDGTGYFISAGRGNADTIIYRLSEDFLSIDEQVRVLWPGQYREAAAVFKRGGRYYMLTSGCTGWAPNQGKYAWADRLDGRWSPLMDFGDETTFHSQSAYVLPVGKDGYLYIGDRWGGSGQAYFGSGYVFLPLGFREDGSLYLDWKENFDGLEVL